MLEKVIITAVKKVLQENIDMKETWCRVRGNDSTIPINIAMTENTTVH